jgi:hypothetical protein
VSEGALVLQREPHLSHPVEEPQPLQDRCQFVPGSRKGPHPLRIPSWIFFPGLPPSLPKGLGLEPNDCCSPLLFPLHLILPAAPSSLSASAPLRAHPRSMSSDEASSTSINVSTEGLRCCLQLRGYVCHLTCRACHVSQTSDLALGTGSSRKWRSHRCGTLSVFEISQCLQSSPSNERMQRSFGNTPSPSHASLHLAAPRPNRRHLHTRAHLGESELRRLSLATLLMQHFFYHANNAGATTANKPSMLPS